MQFLPRDLPSRQAGFTLIELLIGMAIAGLIVLVAYQLLISAAQVQGREEITVPVQESVRGAMEVMSTELREAMTPRVLSAYASPPSGLSSYYSSSSAVTIIVGQADSTFALTKPVGYPVTLGYPSQPVVSVVTPNPNGQTCASAFKVGDYFYLLSMLPGTTDMKVTWGRTAVLGCVGSTLNTTLSVPQINQWTLDSRVLKARLTRYYTGTVNGVNVLYRQTIGSVEDTPQVVAFDITSLEMQYSVDGQTFTATPPTAEEPLAVRITLTGRTNQRRMGTGADTTRTYRLSQVVFMRQTTLPKAF